MKVLVLNGPNLGRLDIRDSSIYGDMTYPALVSHIEGAVIKNKVSIGPYARIRPGTVLENNSKIGNIVETKNSIINKNNCIIKLFKAYFQVTLNRFIQIKNI